MSASEREAAYVIDGLHNNKVIKIDIYSTDTHGFSEVIFGTTHFMHTAFAPKIKNIGEQTIYAFSSKKTYKKQGYKILPSRTINQGLIARHWDDILRFRATIKLKKVTASQLLKRLSSYAKNNPLYKAIKEFGRIIKSIFILTYILWNYLYISQLLANCIDEEERNKMISMIKDGSIMTWRHKFTWRI